MENFKLFHGDCIEGIAKLETDSIHFSVFSPPFADLYTYSDNIADMGNCKNYEEFLTHFNFLTPELYRVTMQGRLVAVHCMDLPIQKGKEGYIGLRDFSGMLIKNFQDNGFIYHSRVTIWKDPVVEMQRTKALGLLHKTLKKDSSMSRVGNPDYVLLFRKAGENPIPIKQDISVDLWQKYASPVWFDINQTNTLQKESARENEDEKHICPLQLDVIERLIVLYSQKGEIVLSPFADIGSEGYTAIKLGRKFIGYELKESYYKQANQNLINAEKLKDQLSLL